MVCKEVIRFSGMKTFVPDFLQPLLHLLYPHYCEGCHTDLLIRESLLCSRCEFSLPATGYWDISGNPIEKIFRGRLPVQAAAANYFFTQDSLLQHLMQSLKYKNLPEAGRWLGKKMGYALQKTDRFTSIDCIIPLPLHSKKEFIRGYNQAQLIAEGISEVWQKPIIQKAVIRNQFTRTQTHENRNSRWNNMQGVFSVVQPVKLEHKHCLLVDDVITTGATLEACGNEILLVKGCSLSLAAAAYTAIQP